MKKENLQKIRKGMVLSAAALLLLLLAVQSEKNSSVFSEEGTIERNPAGGTAKEAELILTGEGLPEGIEYQLTVEPSKITEEEAEELFNQAMDEIDTSFFTEGENADHVTSDVIMKETYADGLVDAEWSFDDYTWISADGSVNNKNLKEDQLVEVSVQLTCGDYGDLYSFPILISPSEKSLEDEIVSAVEENLDAQYETGSSVLKLPETVNGISLQWSEKKQHLVLKMIFLEILAGALLYVSGVEKKNQIEKDRRKSMEREYPEIVSKLSILMGSGITLKMAWKVIISGYREDCEKGVCREKPAYEEMLRCYREMEDGESERIAYQRFGERCRSACFLRFSRLLIRNQQKGSEKMCELLRQEADAAFEERRFAARKAGEEAGTKLLLPLLLMMGIVLAIVTFPAIENFQF